MRKTLCALLSGVLALSLCACGQPVEDIRTDTQQTAAADTQSGAGDTVDLTELSDTMLYSELANILYYDPDSYFGKTIKMTGRFGVYPEFSLFSLLKSIVALRRLIGRLSRMNIDLYIMS